MIRFNIYPVGAFVLYYVLAQIISSAYSMIFFISTVASTLYNGFIQIIVSTLLMVAFPLFCIICIYLYFSYMPTPDPRFHINVPRICAVLPGAFRVVSPAIPAIPAVLPEMIA